MTRLKCSAKANGSAHDSDALGMDRSQVAVLKQLHKVALCCFLQGFKTLWRNAVSVLRVHLSM